MGNLLVLLSVLVHRHLRTLSNWVIASLALTDFLLALIVVPFGTYQVVSIDANSSGYLIKSKHSTWHYFNMST